MGAADSLARIQGALVRERDAITSSWARAAFDRVLDVLDEEARSPLATPGDRDRGRELAGLRELSVAAEKIGNELTGDTIVTAARAKLIADRALAAPAETEAGDEEPWLPMSVERAIERLDRSTAADTISEHRHAVITLQNFARARLAASPPAPTGEAAQRIRIERAAEDLGSTFGMSHGDAIEYASEVVRSIAQPLEDEPAPAGPQAEGARETGATS